MAEKPNIKTDYQDMFRGQEKQHYLQALEIEDIDGEIAILRLELANLIANDPGNIKLQVKLISAIAKLVKIRASNNEKAEDRFKAAVENVINNVIVPLGLTQTTKK